MISSIRNAVPTSVNAMLPLLEEYFRSIGINPRLLRQQNPIGQEMQTNMDNAMRGGGQLANEVDSEVAQELMGGANQDIQQTPVGLVPTSPNASTIGEMGVV